MKKLLAMLFVLSAFAFATNVNNANFQGSDSIWHFDTDMQFTSDFTLSLVSGEVASGNPANLQTGDEVCSGATLRVTPTVSAKWATPDFAAVAIYPTCGGGYCPAMIASGGASSNRNIGWLSTSAWNTQKSFGDANDFSQDSAKYSALGESNFANQPITYNNVTGEFHNNKEGGAAVLCKGTFQVLDGATVKGTSAMPSASSVDFAVNTAGSHAISTRLSGVDCFAAVVKHPLNIADNPSWFWLDYYTHNAPSIPSTVATDTITLTVGTSGGDCAFNYVTGSAEASSSFLDEDIIMLEARIHNTGDPVRIIGVSSSDAGFIATPFPVAICSALGFPPSLCPASNGFNTDIASGANRDLFVLIQRQAGATGGTVLTFNGQTVAATCGGASTCSDTLDIGDDVAITCEVDPASLEVDTLVVAEYTVACENLAGDPIPCTGSNWYWAGLDGGFIVRTNSYAWAYSTDPPGSSGTLNYESGIAHCLSNVNVTDDGLGSEYECEFLPPSATMNISTSRWFDLNCFVNHTQSDPDSADYDTVNGLDGSTSNSSTDGTTYTAPGYEDNGDLQAFSSWAGMPDPMVGIVTLAPINVINGSGNNTNNTNDTNDTPDNPDNPGSSKWCTIGTSSLSVFPGASGWVGIMCGPPTNLTTCTEVVWTTEGGIVLSASDIFGTGYTINGEPHTGGRIIAVVDGIPGHVCWLGFYIAEPECWEYT
ncbi:hypothetical protein L0Y65_06900 [Candidatus Micrarchaeota archaeon]|nr:hypothetical protein [Candidatus Micrarchaeota archaeon]